MKAARARPNRSPSERIVSGESPVTSAVRGMLRDDAKTRAEAMGLILQR